MTESTKHDAWNAGTSYEHYMGRWSRGIAARFVAWLDQPPNLQWLDVGCGTGALTAAIVAHCSPRSVVAVDPSAGFVDFAREAVNDERVRFVVGEAGNLPNEDRSVDVVSSALAYNFFPDRPRALAEMLRVVRPGGAVSFYVWDYPGGGMGLLNAFWKAATALDSGAESLTETNRFPFCAPETLLEELGTAGILEPVVQALEVATHFEDFEAYWHPFTLGAGPAPGYVSSLDDERRQALRQHLRNELGPGPIEFVARAWAARGRAP